MTMDNLAKFISSPKRESSPNGECLGNMTRTHYRLQIACHLEVKVSNAPYIGKGTRQVVRLSAQLLLLQQRFVPLGRFHAALVHSPETLG